MRIIFVSVFIALLFFSASCSSDSSGFDEGPMITVVAPMDDSVFEPGAVMHLALATTNFELGPPNESPASDAAHDHDESDAEHEHAELAVDNSELEAEHDHSTHEHGLRAELLQVSEEALYHEQGALDSHTEPEHENMQALSPGSRDGHYHIYLDSARDSDPHLTAWDYEVDYQLPADIAPGSHLIYIELRDNNHNSVEVGGERRFTVLFFTVAAAVQ